MNDSELIHQILSGNMNAFTFLVKQHQKLVSHLVVRIIQKQEDVQDVCQEVFIKVFKNLKHFKGESKLSTWIASIAYNTSISYQKKNGKHFYQQAEDGNNQQKIAIENHPQQILEKAEIKSIIKRKIEELPENYRTVITMYHLQEFSYKEIEEITGLPEGTIKTHLFRARKILKEKLTFVNKKDGGYN